jgi:RNAse (barnase) inhibitor barstar
MKVNEFIFSDSWIPEGPVFLGAISEPIGNVSELFESLQNALHFPDYFGANWNALSECLRDFHWIREKRVVLKHAALPDITIQELDIYLEILLEATQDWQSDSAHSLEVIFPESARIKVSKMIAM